MQSTFIILLTVNFLARVWCSRFYCRRVNFSETIHIGQGGDQHLLFSEIGDGESSDVTHCVWKFALTAEGPRQIVLEGTPWSQAADDEDTRRRMLRSVGSSSELERFHIRLEKAGNQCTDGFNGTADLGSGDLRVVSLWPGNKMIVTSRVRFRKANVALRVIAMKPGYCAGHMVHRSGRCYYIAGRNSALTDAVSSLELGSLSGVQLAGFESADDILDCLDHNFNPEFTGPTKQPLNLTSPARIGLFLSKDGQVFRPVATSRNCTFRAVDFPDEILSLGPPPSGSCGSLRVNGSGSPIVEFVNCSLPMPALISFPERPTKVCPKRHRCQLAGFVDELRRAKQSHTDAVICMPFLAAVAIGLLVFVLIIVCISLVMKFCHSRTPAFTRSGATISRVPLNTAARSDPGNMEQSAEQCTSLVLSVLNEAEYNWQLVQSARQETKIFFASDPGVFRWKT